MPETAGYVFFIGYPVEAGGIQLFLAFLFIKSLILKNSGVFNQIPVKTNAVKR